MTKQKWAQVFSYRRAISLRAFHKGPSSRLAILHYFQTKYRRSTTSSYTIAEGWREKQRQRSSRQFGGQILLNSLPR